MSVERSLGLIGTDYQHTNVRVTRNLSVESLTAGKLLLPAAAEEDMVLRCDANGVASWSNGGSVGIVSEQVQNCPVYYFDSAENTQVPVPDFPASCLVTRLSDSLILLTLYPWAHYPGTTNSNTIYVRVPLPSSDLGPTRPITQQAWTHAAANVDGFSYQQSVPAVCLLYSSETYIVIEIRVDPVNFTLPNDGWDQLQMIYTSGIIVG